MCKADPEHSCGKGENLLIVPSYKRLECEVAKSASSPYSESYRLWNHGQLAAFSDLLFAQ